MEDNVFSEGDGSEEVQKSGTGEDGDRAEDKTPSQPSTSTKVSNNRATFSAFLSSSLVCTDSSHNIVAGHWRRGCLVLAR